MDCNCTQEEIYTILGEHERTSVKLSVSIEYKEIFKNIRNYLENEKKEVNDDELQQEIDLLQSLIEY